MNSTEHSLLNVALKVALLCSRSSTFRHVFHPTQHSYLLTFSKPPPLCRWYPTFFSFHPRNFYSSISHLQTALQLISYGSANLLTLNSYKTKFLIIGLKQQLSKIDNSSLNTTHSARNLGFIFDEHLTFSDQISSLSKSCYSHIRHLRCICPYLDSKTASTIAASIVHSKLDYCNSLYYNFPKSQTSSKFRTVLHVLW